MSNLVIQLLGLTVLAVVVIGGYWRWVRPHNLTLETKGLFLLIILTMAGGFIGSTGWWIDDPRAFSWDLPPLASRMLAAAGWAFGAATFMTLQRPTTRRLRLVLLMLAVYLVPLAVVIILFHLNRFDGSAPITYAFFIIVTAMIVPTLWYLARPPKDIAENKSDTIQPVRDWLMFIAVVTGLWGLALFITDSGPLNLIWVWPGDLLTSRLIAVMLLTLMAAALYSLRHADTVRITLIVMIVYGFGVALANLWNLTAGKPVQPLYTVAFGAMGIISLLTWSRRKTL